MVSAAHLVWTFPSPQSAGKRAKAPSPKNADGDDGPTTRSAVAERRSSASQPNVPQIEHYGPDFGGPLGVGAEGLFDGSYLAIGSVLAEMPR